MAAGAHRRHHMLGIREVRFTLKSIMISRVTQFLNTESYIRFVHNTEVSLVFIFSNYRCTYM